MDNSKRTTDFADQETIETNYDSDPNKFGGPIEEGANYMENSTPLSVAKSTSASDKENTTKSTNEICSLSVLNMQ